MSESRDTASDASVQSALPCLATLRDTPRVVQARRITVALLLALVLVAGVWRLLDWRLGAETRRLAAEGHSGLAPSVVVDWAPTVVAIALADDSEPAQRARFVVNQRIDVAVASAREGDTRQLIETSGAVLHALRQSPDTLTSQGASWAERVARRVIDVTAEVEAEQRLRLLADADDTLTTITGKPTTPSPPPARVEPTSSIATVEESPSTPATPAPTETVAQPAEPPALSQPQPTPPTPAPPNVAEADSPSPWQPDWRSLAPIPSPAEPKPEVVDLAPPSAPGPPTDRELLAELLELANQLRSAAGPVARGPTRAPAGGDANDEAVRRFELVRTDLAERGFQGVAEWQLIELLAEEPGRRVALAERLVTERSGDGARLLLVLADDADPKVRVAAIQALGSSTSRSLVEVAWRLASSDPDPNVGRLAEPLRQLLR